MRKLACLGILAAALAVAHPAYADGPWTGFYIGGFAGYAWGDADSTLTIADGPPANCHFLCPAGGNDAALAQVAGSPSFDPSGFTGGGQFGYNWQSSNWILGVEVDFGSFSQRETANGSVALPANSGALNCFPAATCVGNFSTSVKADWLLTVRPRLGYAWDHTMAYVTGGLAVSKLSFSQWYSDNIDFLSGTGGSVSLSSSKVLAGWAVGGGIEHRFGTNWSVKAEYLYVRFDGLNATGTLTDGLTAAFGDFAVFANEIDLSSSMARVGVNYRFGAAPNGATY